MFEQINDLKLSGGYLKEETILSGIFKDRINLVYGPNGSGKSTISRALANYAVWLERKSALPTDVPYAEFSSEQNHELADRLYVFNEDFVDNNVKVSAEGLESIVMLGQNEIAQEDEIKNIESRISELTSQRNELMIELHGNSAAGIKSLEKKKAELEDAVINRLKNGYAERGRDIKGQTNRIQVKLGDFLNVHQNLSQLNSNITGIAENISAGIKELQAVKAGDVIRWQAEDVPSLPIQKINQLLCTVLSMNELGDERLEELARASRETLEEAHRKIVEPGLDFCPYCQQPISPDWMEILKERLKKVLNQDAENFKQQVDAEIENLIKADFVCPDVVEEKFGNELNKLKLAYKDWNDYVEKLRQLLQAKKSNLYAVSETVDFDEYERCAKQLRMSKDQLNQEIDKYNNIVVNYENKKEKLLKLNLVLGYWENKEFFSQIETLKTRMIEIGQQLHNLEVEQNKYEESLMQINSGRRNTTLAMKFINNCLRTVFADPNRMKLVKSEKEGKYKLTVRNQNVAPKNISVGERNILALSYFFAKIFEGKEEKNKYQKEVFIVIDDPVSSFDQGNQSGVWVLMKSIIEELFLEKSENSKKQIGSSSKLLLLSHERQVIINMLTLKKALCKEQKQENTNKRNEIYQLCRKGNSILLRQFESKGSLYMMQLNALFDFVTASEENLDEVAFYGIGNTLRQVLEAFAKFYNNSDCKSILENDFVWSNFSVNGIMHIPKDSEYYRRQDLLKEKVRTYLSREVTNIMSHSPNNADISNEEYFFDLVEIQKQVKYFFLTSALFL